jgi:pimeloyl-ACP methyl ester carboxylesterase
VRCEGHTRSFFNTLSGPPVHRERFWRGRSVTCPVILVVIALALAIGGCDVPSETDVPPTETLVIIAASRTVAPVPPTIVTLQGANIGDENFTPGAPLVNDANPAVTLTPTPAPTMAAIPLQFTADDGLIIAGTFVVAPTKPSPTVLLLHMPGGNRESWRAFASQLQAAGYNALAIDLRGHGETGGKVNWAKAPGDIKSVLERLATLPGVDPRRINVVGADGGANLALTACADFPNCRSVVMLSPAADFQGIKATDEMARYGRRPVLIVASKGDAPSGADSIALDKAAQGDHQLQLYEGKAHGTALLGAQTTLPALIVQWLASRNS